MIRQFYAAVNDVLNGGDPAALDALVAPDVAVHLGGRQFTGADWERQLAALAAPSPGQTVRATQITAAGDHAAAVIERGGSPRPAPGVVIGGAPPVQDATEAFRLAGGRIVEYWSALDEESFARVLPPLPLPLPAGMAHAALVRFALPPGAVVADLTAPGPHLLLPETGSVVVSADGAAQMASIETGGGWRPAPAKQAFALGPGDAMLVPAGVRHTLRNETSAGATLLGLLVYTLADVSGVQQLPPLTALYATAPYGRSFPIDDASADLLARGTDACAICRGGAVRVVWAPLASGQSIAVDPGAGMAFVATEAGAVSTGRGRFAPPTGQPAPTVETAAPRIVAVGEATSVAPGASDSFVTAEDAGASLLLIELGRPKSEAAIASTADVSPGGA
jgi:quercetin dioxygenase-like cupin family protein